MNSTKEEILLNIFLKKRWKDSYKLIEPYRHCQTVDLGVIDVETKEIIGLSISENELINDHEAWSYLNGEIEKNGWNDPYPQTLHLYYLPIKKYIVGSGGNHRTYLATQKKIPKIKALVTVFIPDHCLTLQLKGELDAIELKRKELEKESMILNNWLKEKGVLRINYTLEEESLQKLYLRMDKEEENYRNVLLDIASRNNLLPI